MGSLVNNFTTTTLTFRTYYRTGISYCHCRHRHRHRRRLYFTNGRDTKNSDPYSILGLQWGDGATTAEIKAAFRSKARELHPDVNTKDTPQQALKKFQKLQKAYESLIDERDGTNSYNNIVDLEEWRVGVFRRAERLALDRTDVAGIMRKRPIPPANSKVFSKEIGHPQGGGSYTTGRGEYLTTGEEEEEEEEGSSSSSSSYSKSSSVGSGRNKWVKPKEFIPWNGGKGTEK